MASVFAKGVTVIDNAAREPEIVDLANMLNKMGANIQGAGSPVIEIHGVTELHPVEHEVVGDRIEAGTFLAIGALTGEPITVHGFEPNHLGLVLKKYEQMGITIETGDRWQGLLASKILKLSISRRCHSRVFQQTCRHRP